MGGSSTADDFTIAGNTAVKSVGFFNNNYSGINGWDGQISYAIHADNGGSAGAVLVSGAGLNVTPFRAASLGAAAEIPPSSSPLTCGNFQRGWWPDLLA